jgi:hypothetical protein
MIKNKKAKLMDYTLGLIPKIIFTITVIVVSLVVIGGTMKVPELNRKVDADVVSSLIMYNPAIMIIDENTQRLYPGWIDIDKIQSKEIQENFTETMKTYNDIYYLGMNISLFDINNRVITNFYYREKEYKSSIVLVESNINKGAGAYKRYNYFYPIYYGQNKVSGFLKIEVILPN